MTDEHSKACAVHITKPLEHECNCTPRLFYYEEAVDAWVQAPEKVENIIEAEQIDPGETISIEFRNIPMTDQEIEDMPEG